MIELGSRGLVIGRDLFTSEGKEVDAMVIRGIKVIASSGQLPKPLDLSLTFYLEEFTFKPDIMLTQIIEGPLGIVGELEGKRSELRTYLSRDISFVTLPNLIKDDEGARIVGRSIALLLDYRCQIKEITNPEKILEDTTITLKALDWLAPDAQATYNIPELETRFERAAEEEIRSLIPLLYPLKRV